MNDRLIPLLIRARHKIGGFPLRHVWRDVVAPFAFTRGILLVVGWFSGYFAPNPDYPITEAFSRGWIYSPHRLLDIWGRWDTGWYMSIVGGGYSVRGDIQTTQSSLAFSPLYPYIVRWLAYLIPLRLRTPGAVLFVGVVVSNALLLGALVMLYELVATFLLDRATARRTVLYTLVFPTSFFLSCFYTESAFLFLSVAAFYAATRQAWLPAGIAAALVTVTRPLGVLIVVPLGLMYLESHEWRVREIRWEVAWLLLAPAALLAFLLSIRPLTGKLLAPLLVQAAWGRSFAMPWHALLNPSSMNAYVTPIERVLTIGMLLAAIASVALSPKGLGAYALLLTLPPLFTGTLASTARFAVVVFPAFIVLALVGRRRVLDRILTVSLLVIQVLFFSAWSQFYWIA